MVDVSAKAVTARTAVAAGIFRTTEAVVAAIADGAVPKGDVLATARIAGIMAVKRTADLIPLCHPLPISGVTVDLAAGTATGDEAGSDTLVSIENVIGGSSPRTGPAGVSPSRQRFRASSCGCSTSPATSLSRAAGTPNRSRLSARSAESGEPPTDPAAVTGYPPPAWPPGRARRR